MCTAICPRKEEVNRILAFTGLFSSNCTYIHVFVMCVQVCGVF